MNNNECNCDHRPSDNFLLKNPLAESLLFWSLIVIIVTLAIIIASLPFAGLFMLYEKYEEKKQKKEERKEKEEKGSYKPFYYNDI